MREKAHEEKGREFEPQIQENVLAGNSKYRYMKKVVL